MGNLVMQEEFNKMIENENNVSHYLISTPFSTVNNVNYGNTLTPEIFKNNFLVYDNLKIIEADIINYLDDIAQNTVLITGYQGCGKTTFVNYLTKNIQKHYEEKMKYSNVDVIDFEEQDDEENNYERMSPFQQILIQRVVDEFSKSSSDNKVLKIFLDGYRDNIDIFNRVGKRMKLKSLFIFLRQNMGQEFYMNPDLELKLYKLLEDLSIVQILIIWSFFIICKRYNEDKNDFVEIIIFDNIDDIYNDNFTESFIRGIRKYHEIGSRFISSIKLGKNKFNLYSNFNFILCLRDTSAAKFSFHFVTRAVQFFHIDISEKINKKEIMNKKLRYLDLVNNEKLKKNSEIIKSICNDNYTVSRIFPFYNNDYRTATQSLCSVLEKNPIHAQEYSEMTLDRDNSAFHFGAHGIILFLILDSFEKQGYFKSIGSYKIIEDKNFNNGEKKSEVDEIKYNIDSVDYSIPRVILTYLFGFQQNHRDNFLNNLPDSTISLKQIYDDFHKVIKFDNIAQKLVAMYILHEKKDWNHLVNINAIYQINNSNLKNIFMKYSNGMPEKQEDGRIQITCAGRVFVRIITTHFEYFSCRYLKNSIPLFMNENLLQRDGKYGFDTKISSVFTKVSECCNKAYNFDMRVNNEYFGGNQKEFKNSVYLYKGKYKEQVNRQTHVERILNHNISYIDAYRQYILQRAKDIQGKEELTDFEKIIDSDKNEICKILLMHIKNYIDEIKKYINKGYISQKTIDLYEKKYLVGMKKIGTNYLSEEEISFEMDRITT